MGREVARVEGRQVKWLEDKPINRQASWAKVVNRQVNWQVKMYNSQGEWHSERKNLQAMCLAGRQMGMQKGS